MGNLICVMSHCWGRGMEVILGDKCHIHNYEQGGIAHVSVFTLSINHIIEPFFCFDFISNSFSCPYHLILKIAGVHHRSVRNLPDGTFDLNEVRTKLHDPTNDDDHEAWTSLVCIENTHNKAGGKTVPLEWIMQVPCTTYYFIRKP